MDEGGVTDRWGRSRVLWRVAGQPISALVALIGGGKACVRRSL